MRTDKVRTLALAEMGPWAQGGMCSRGIPAVFGMEGTTHLAEAPFFFHCLSCHAANKRKPPRWHPRRDYGLCMQCGGPAELLRNIVRSPAASAQQAEAAGVTIARLSTRKFCAECDPFSKPMCRASACPDKAKPHRSILTCKNPSTHRLPHCAAECARQKELHAANERRTRSRRPSLS